MFLRANEQIAVRPSIYTLRNMNTDDFIDTLKVRELNGQNIMVDDFAKVREVFEIHLKDTIGKIFDPDESFRMTDHLKKCDYCPFSQLCQR